MGAVDLVIQVESPESVARGLQRVGRAGHQVGRAEHGQDLPEVPRRPARGGGRRASAMREGAIEETRIPRNPLDVLAQQIVAICARRRDRRVDDLHDARARGAYLRRSLAAAARERARHARGPLPVGRVRRAAAAHRVGPRRRAPSEARGGARRLAVTNGGHDPRSRPVRRVPASTAAAASASSTRRWSTRAAPGETFVLGASHLADRGDHARAGDRLARARASRARCRSGRATAPGARSSSGGRSARSRASSPRSRTRRRSQRLQRRHRLDELAARNLLAYLDEQAEATGAVPDDRTIVVERFRDEIGDWRVCILTPFGARVHAPWALAIERAAARRARRSTCSRSGPTTGSCCACPRPTTRRRSTICCSTADDVEELVVAELPQTRRCSPRGSARTRRARCCCRGAGPGGARRCGSSASGRRPARGGARLRLASRSCSRRTRECLQDVFDLPALQRGAARACARARSLVTVETAAASPFAAVAAVRLGSPTYMYEGDAPLAERRAAGARRSTATCCASCSAPRSCASCSTPGALAEVEAQLRAHPSATADEVHDLLRRARRPADDELDRGLAAPCWRGAPRARACASPATERLDRRRGRRPVPRRAGRDAAARPARRVPRACADALRALAAPLRTRAAARSRPAELAARSDSRLAASRTRSALEGRPPRPGRVPAGRQRARVVRPGRAAAPAARSLAALRREVEPVERGAGPLPPGLARHRPARATCGRRSCRCRGWRSPSALWERTCCRAACPATSPRSSTSCAPPARWCGSGPDTSGWPLFFREDAPRSARPPGAQPGGARTTAIRAALAGGRVLARPAGRYRSGVGGRAARALGARLGRRGDERRVDAAPRATAATARRVVDAAGRVDSRARRCRVVTATQGRWSLAGRLFPGPPTAARSPSSCSSGKASSRETAFAQKASPAATAPSTRSCARSRRSARAGAATSSKARRRCVPGVCPGP